MDFVILTGDQAVFDPVFGAAIVVPVPGTITGSAAERSLGRQVCALGDEASVVVPGVAYSTPAFPQPGVGILTILSLAADQQAMQATSSGRPLILRGTKFQARFQVIVPASNPTSADVVPLYLGTGGFLTTNTTTRAA
jgi:hypothetical protein